MATSLNATLNVNLNPQSLNASTKQIQQALGRITGQASEFQKSLDASTARVFAFGATTLVINGVTQSFKKLVSTTIDVQKRLVEINSIFQATDATFNKFRNSIFKVAKETGQSFNTVAEGAAELARQGLSAEQTASRLKSALILTRISGLDAEKSVKALTAAINGFASAGLNANQIVNKLVAVDTAFAVSAQDLAEAFSRAGSTAEDAGVSFNELLGLVTAVEQKTARGGAVIGNAFKSIFTRLQRGTTIEKLKELGVEIDATQTGVQKLMALSTAIEGLADPTVVSKIKELAGGVFQINVVSAALKDLGSNTSIFQKAAVTAASATQEALEKNAALNTTISSQINSLVVGLTSLAERIGTITFGPLLEGLVGLATKVTDFLDTALDPARGNVFVKGLFKTIGQFLSGPAVIIFTAAFIKIFKLVASFASQGLKTLFTMGTQTERIKQIEGGIVGLLQRDQQLRNAITSSTASQVQKEQAVIQAIQRENALLQQQASIMRNLAGAAAARGVTGMGANGTFTGKKGKAFSTGFMQEEASARMLGASSGVQAHFGKGRIGGERFVMNNQEIEIPNFAGGNSAVIPMYAGGNMPRYAAGDSVYSEADIKKLGAGKKLSNAMATAKFNRSPLAVQNLAQNQKSGKTATTEQVFGVTPRTTNVGPTVMLVPNIGLSDTVRKGTFGRTKIKGKSAGYEYMEGLPVEGPKVPRAVDQAADPHDENLERNVVNSVTKEASKFAGLLKPILGKPSPSVIEAGMNRQGGGKGAIQAVVGSAFEASVNAALNISPARSKEGGDFDVKNVSGKKRTAIDKLFGIKATKAATATYDYKNTHGVNAQGSFAKKLVNQNAFGMKTRPLKRKKSFAGGYMPKFAKGSGGSKGGSGEGSGGMGGGKFAMVAMSLQFAMNSLGNAFGNNTNLIAENTEEKKSEILASEKSFSSKMKEIKALNASNAAIKEGESSMMGLTTAMNLLITAIMSAQALNMVTGGMGSKMTAAMGGFGKKLKGKQNARIISKSLKNQSPNVQKIGKGSTSAKELGKRLKNKGFSEKFTSEVKSNAQNNIKATNSKMGKIGKLGKGAGLLGVGFAGFETFDAIKDKQAGEITEKRRNERIGGAGGALAGGMALGKLGTMGGFAVGGPVGAAIGGIGGAIVGAIVGGFAGEKVGGLFGSDEIPMGSAMAEQNAIKNKNFNLGFGGGEKGSQKFNKRVEENLKKLDSEGLDTTAVQAEYISALDANIELNKKENVSFEDKLAAEKRVEAAARKLAGMRFSHIDDQKDWEERNEKAQNLLTAATKKLERARSKSANIESFVNERIGYRGGSLKGQNERAQLQAGLQTSSKSPFGASTMLASQQNAMMTNLAELQQNKLMAEAEFASKKDAGQSSGEELDDLAKKSAEAGEEFKKEATKAGTNFLNKITKTEDIIARNKKSIDDATKAARKNKGGMVDDIVRGGGIDYDRLASNLGTITGLMDKGGNRTDAETRDMSRSMAFLDNQGTKVETNALLETYLINVKKMSEEQAKAMIDALRLTMQDAFSTSETKDGKAIRSSIESQMDKDSGSEIGPSTKALIIQQNDLTQQLLNTHDIFNQFNKNPATAGLAGALIKLKEDLGVAGSSLVGLKTYVSNNLQTSEKAALFMEEAKDFFESKREELKILRNDVFNLKTQIGSINAEG